MTRADVPFNAYSLTVPLWKFVPPSGISPAQVRMPDGSLVPSEDVAERWNRKDEDLHEAFFSYLDADETYTVVQLLKKISELEIPYVDKVIPLLEHDSKSVRRQALEVIAKREMTPMCSRPVAEMMREDKDKELARKAAAFLGKSSTSEYSVLEQFYLLEHGSDAEAAKAAKALGAVKGDDRVLDKLYERLSDKREAVAEAASASIEKLGADELQKRALADDDVPDRVEAVRSPRASRKTGTVTRSLPG